MRSPKSFLKKVIDLLNYLPRQLFYGIVYIVQLSRSKQNNVVLLATLIANSFLVMCLLAILYQTPVAPISAQVTTEVWSIDIQAGSPFPEYLSGKVRTSEAFKSICARSTNDSSTFLDVDFPRTAPTAMRIMFVSIDKNSLAVTLQPSHEKFPVSQIDNSIPYATIRCGEEHKLISESMSVIYPVNSKSRRMFLAYGNVILGRLPRRSQFDGPKVLLSGEIIAAALSYPSRTGRVEFRSQLMLGDEVDFFYEEGRNTSGTSSVIASYESDISAFQVVVHSEASRANVKQMGLNESYPIASAPSLWARVQAQSEWAILLGIIALIVNSIGAYRHYRIIESLRELNSRQSSENVVDLAE